MRKYRPAKARLRACVRLSQEMSKTAPKMREISKKISLATLACISHNRFTVNIRWLIPYITSSIKNGGESAATLTDYC